MQNDSQTPIILASTSPRRIYLMSHVRLNVEALTPDVDERPKKGEKPKALVLRLAREKAESVHKIAVQRYEKCIIIAADTIVISPVGQKILGKPKDHAEAKKYLKILSGKKHSVLTGYCILFAQSNKRTSKKITRVVESKVKLRALSDMLIDQYVQTGEPMDKAGAYGAQGLGMALVEKIEGSYTNVVGLPMAQILNDLEKVFKIPVYSWIK